MFFADLALCYSHSYSHCFHGAFIKFHFSGDSLYVYRIQNFHIYKLSNDSWMHCSIFRQWHPLYEIKAFLWRCRGLECVGSNGFQWVPHCIHSPLVFLPCLHMETKKLERTVEREKVSEKCKNDGCAGTIWRNCKKSNTMSAICCTKRGKRYSLGLWKLRWSVREGRMTLLSFFESCRKCLRNAIPSKDTVCIIKLLKRP